MIKIKTKIITCALLLLVMIKPAEAIVERDLQVAARIFSFVEAIDIGTVELAIIYDKTRINSVTDAKKLNKLLSTEGLVAGQYTLVPNMIDITDLNKIDTNLAYVSLDMQDSFEEIADMAEMKHIFTFTKDFECLIAQKCVLALETQPDVKIEISDDAAVRSGLAFGMALRMMVKMKD